MRHAETRPARDRRIHRAHGPRSRSSGASTSSFFSRSPSATVIRAPPPGLEIDASGFANPSAETVTMYEPAITRRNEYSPAPSVQAVRNNAPALVESLTAALGFGWPASDRSARPVISAQRTAASWRVQCVELLGRHGLGRDRRQRSRCDHEREVFRCLAGRDDQNSGSLRSSRCQDSRGARRKTVMEASR